jgi:hypothetical protein
MRCRGHSNWPPAWTWIGGKENKNPKGELGVLKQARLATAEPFLNRCFLWMEYEDSAYLGCLVFDDRLFCEQVYRLLGENCGSSIRDIGSLEMDD